MKQNYFNNRNLISSESRLPKNISAKTWLHKEEGEVTNQVK